MAQKFNPLSGNFDLVLDKASEIKYVNTTSGLTATELQSAVDEIEAQILGLPTPFVYKGTWDASTNTPTLSNSDSGQDGFLYYCNVAGTVDFGAGPIEFAAGDKVANEGNVWEKWDQTDAVVSVNGKLGAVVLTTTDISEGDNLYFTESRAQDAIPGYEYLPNVTSDIQAQLDAKVETVAGDILQTTFTAPISGTAADVTGATFANATVRSFNLTVDAIGTSVYQTFAIKGTQTASDWVLSQSSYGDDAGIAFSITSSGQIQYISDTALTLKFKADVINV